MVNAFIRILSLFHILTSFMHISPISLLTNRLWAVNESMRFWGCLTLPILHRSTWISRVGNNFHFWSETLRYYGSNVLFTMIEAITITKSIKVYVLLCATIGFKQRYGHKTLRHAVMNLWYKSDFMAEIGPYFIDRKLCVDVIWCQACL